eukprot:UN05535
MELLLEKDNRESDYGRTVKRLVSHIPWTERQLWFNAFQSLIWNNAVNYRLNNIERKLMIGDQVVKIHRSNNLDVEIITAENMNHYDFQDIVLPLPGYNQHIPNDFMNEFYQNEP